MKHLKAKLMATVTSLLLASVMLVSSSFAWFTISTKPEISNIDSTLAANGNLEIALASDADFTTAPAASDTTDAGKNTKWGNLVDLTAFDGIELKPVAFDTATGAITIPNFGLDGRISGTAAATPAFTALANTAAVTNFADGGITLYKDAAGTPWAFSVDFFVRTNVAGAISLLETGADRGAQDTSGAGTSIESGCKASVAFAVDGTMVGVFYDGTATTPAWDFTTPIIASATANTVYKVRMYVYFNGASLTNATLPTTTADLNLNVQFTHSETLTPLAVQGVNYDKNSTTTTTTSSTAS